MFDNLDKTKKEGEDNIVNSQNNTSNSAEGNNIAIPQNKDNNSTSPLKQNMEKSKGVEDIFQETDKFSPDNKNLPPDISKDQLERMKFGDSGFSSEKHRPYKGPVSKGVKTMRVIILIILIVGVIGFGSYYLYNNVFMTEENNQEENSENQSEENNQEEMGEDLGNNKIEETEVVKDPLVEEEEIKKNEEEELKAKDSDADDLNDWEEINFYGTNPLNSDSDSDGLKDGDETYIYNTDPLELDTDSDGLKDGEEILIYKTDPLISDSDGDGYSDGSEVSNGYNPLGEGKLSL